MPNVGSVLSNIGIANGANDTNGTIIRWEDMTCYRNKSCWTTAITKATIIHARTINIITADFTDFTIILVATNSLNVQYQRRPYAVILNI